MTESVALSYDPRASVPFWIISSAHMIEQVYNEVLAPLGITFRQAEVLALLAMEGTMSQSEVADRMGVEAPTLAGIVSRMEAAGWIVRDTINADRRKKYLRPTAKVAPIWSQVMERAQSIRSLIARDIAPERIEELKKTLEQIQGNLSSRPTPRHFQMVSSDDDEAPVPADHQAATAR
jgi:MarR family transcriptional regulator for hemolysin